MKSEELADPIRSAVGQAVRKARKDAGLSMRSLARLCSVSQPFISAIERGNSTPSIATLYRLADVLGTEPAALLPVRPMNDVCVVRADEGELVPSSDRPNSAMGRIILSDDSRHIEIYEYFATSDEDLDVWFEHPGEVVLNLLSGRLEVDLAGRPKQLLGPGDCLVHPGSIPHRWTVLEGEQARILLTVVRSQPMSTAHANHQRSN